MESKRVRPGGSSNLTSPGPSTRLARQITVIPIVAPIRTTTTASEIHNQLRFAVAAVPVCRAGFFGEWPGRTPGAVPGTGAGGAGAAVATGIAIIGMGNWAWQPGQITVWPACPGSAANHIWQVGH